MGLSTHLSHAFHTKASFPWFPLHLECSKLLEQPHNNLTKPLTIKFQSLDCPPNVQPSSPKLC